MFRTVVPEIGASRLAKEDTCLGTQTGMLDVDRICPAG
jgi:hypothetical protein